jgi:hypothetical protein
MEIEYDVFETLQDRSLIWHTCARGTKLALAKLQKISQMTPNECFAIHIDTKTIIGKVQARSVAP